MLLKIQNSILKYPVFVKTSKKYKKIKKKKKKKCFCAYGQVSQSKKSYCVFFIQQKNNVLACILALITSLLKSREHWPKFQKQQKFYFVCLLVSGV